MQQPVQPIRMLVVGASGTGASTLGKTVASAIEVAHIDSDDILWVKNDIPYSVQRERPECVEMLRTELAGKDSWIISRGRRRLDPRAR